jgi:hypothetical protein
VLRHLVKFSPFLDYHDLKLSKRVGEEEEEEEWSRDATATATTPNNTHSPATAAARSRRFAAL